MGPLATYSARFDEALAFAVRAHEGQVRKGTETPYIVHPVNVARILAAHGFDEDVAIAGLLHDTLEDCDVSREQLSARFGERVAALVAGVTQPKLADGRKLTWRERKAEAVAHIAAGGVGLAALKAADALHNSAATLHDVMTGGAGVWARFNAGPDDIVWYYREIARACRVTLGEHALVADLHAVVAALAERVPGRAR